MDLIERSAKLAKKKTKGSSLVERAAETSGNSPFREIGGGAKAKGATEAPKEAKRRDPSSMNPVQEPVARSIGGIGNAGARKKPVNEHPKLDQVKEEEPRGLAIGIGRATEDKKGASQKKEVKVEEVDLVTLREGGYITPDMPPNLMSEEFRIIKRTLLLNAFSKGMQKSKNSNVILVTSSNPGEGKTFCTINLALSVATEQDTTVLLIDADFSKPEILNRLGVAGGRGLMDVVADSELELADCLIRTNIPNLVLLPAGRQHNLTTELLASERMETIVNGIANRYPDRLVIFDSPPVLASSAASVLALYMGQTMFVIEAENTTEPQIKESLNMISACENINLLLNQTRFSGSNKRFASYYGYGGR